MYKEKYESWLNSNIISEEIKEELRNIKDDKIEPMFFRALLQDGILDLTNCEVLR